MSDSVRPHRRQPTRLPRPWDSPGKNIGVGCHFLLQCMNVKSEREVAQSCPTLSDPMDYTRLLRPWDFLGKRTGVGCHCLFCVLVSTLEQNEQATYIHISPSFSTLFPFRSPLHFCQHFFFKLCIYPLGVKWCLIWYLFP